MDPTPPSRGDRPDAAVLVLTTWPADRDPAGMARAIVTERLAACVTVIGPVQSIYRWQGAVEQADERQLILKTVAPRVEALKARVAELHPYDVPELLVLPIAGGGAAYLRWVGESTQE
jgi:periplasmic divalent cation tolerance protein